MTKTITVIGDSQTDANTVSSLIRPERCNPEQLADMLRRRGADVRSRNFGISGDTSTGVLARIYQMQAAEVPDLAVIEIGVNDPSAPIVQAVTQANAQAAIKSLKYGALGPAIRMPDGELRNTGAVTVADQTALPANGLPGQRYVVLQDGSTTGGAARDANDPTQHATITGTIAADANGNKQTVWEFRDARPGVNGWGRVAVKSTTPWACERIAVIPPTYRNFTTGGDTPSVPDATNATVRAALTAAVTEEAATVAGVQAVVYADLYTMQRAMIVAGSVPDFSAVAYDATQSWHAVQNNQHGNEWYHHLAAQAVIAYAPAAWLTALGAS